MRPNPSLNRSVSLEPLAALQCPARIFVVVSSRDADGSGSALELPVVDGHRFTPADFEYDFERDKLSEHGVTFEEAVECFFSDYQIRRNKKYVDRHQLLGQTVGGRKLKIIFQLKPHSVVRIITGRSL